MPTTAPPLLEVDQLRVTLQTPYGPADAVRGLSFSMARRDTVGLVGESGCGKSLTAMALMELHGGTVTASARIPVQLIRGRSDAEQARHVQGAAE
jgi:peptide/nickel transport system ATP-binding protein